MTRQPTVLLTALALILACHTPEVPAQAKVDSKTKNGNQPATRKRNAVNNNPQGNHASINGLKLYYEIHAPAEATAANVEPLLLLHGGVGAIEMFGPLLPAFAQGRKVIAVDLPGHGRLTDIDGPLRFERMADDIAALMKQIDVAHSDIMGYSLGGGVALQIAIRHPQRVRKLVVVSSTFKREGWYPEVLVTMAQMGPGAAAGIKQSPLAQLYPEVDWAVLFGKLGDLLRTDYDWSKEIAAIKAPTMIVFADADSIRPAHVVEFFGLLGGGKKDGGLDGSGRPVAQLAVLPGFTHYNILSSPTLPLIVPPFLDAPLPKHSGHVGKHDEQPKN